MFLVKAPAATRRTGLNPHDHSIHRYKYRTPTSSPPPTASYLSTCIGDSFRNGDLCESCPSPGARCEAGADLEGIEVLQGYYRFSRAAVAIYECTTPEACVGGVNVSDWLCRTGHASALCSTCVQEPEPYYLDKNTGLCVSCDSPEGGISLGVILLIVIAVLGLTGRAWHIHETNFISTNFFLD